MRNWILCSVRVRRGRLCVYPYSQCIISIINRRRKDAAGYVRDIDVDNGVWRPRLFIDRSVKGLIRWLCIILVL